MIAPAFLSHLRTDNRGRPVPYINRWGDDDVERFRIRHDVHVRQPGLFLDEGGQAEPDFFHQEMGRQRECMVAGLCQVCARPVPWSRRFLVVSSMSTEHVDFYGYEATVITEPWLDERCADFATSVCPALIRRRTAEDLTVLPVTSQRQVTLAVSTGWVDGPLEAESRELQPAMWVKLIIRGVSLIPAKQLAEVSA